MCISYIIYFHVRIGSTPERNNQTNKKTLTKAQGCSRREHQDTGTSFGCILQTLFCSCAVHTFNNSLRSPWSLLVAYYISQKEQEDDFAWGHVGPSAEFHLVFSQGSGFCSLSALYLTQTKRHRDAANLNSAQERKNWLCPCDIAILSNLLVSACAANRIASNAQAEQKITN